MVDLADIRKKAKGKGGKVPAQPPAESVPSAEASVSESEAGDGSMPPEPATRSEPAPEAGPETVSPTPAAPAPPEPEPAADPAATVAPPASSVVESAPGEAEIVLTRRVLTGGPAPEAAGKGAAPPSIAGPEGERPPASTPSAPPSGAKNDENEEPIVLLRPASPPPAPKGAEPKPVGKVVAPNRKAGGKDSPIAPQASGNPAEKGRPAESVDASAGRAEPTPPGSIPTAEPKAPGEEGEAVEPQIREFLTFSLGGEEYAMPIDRIVEIVPWRTTTLVPNADETVVGILSLRGVVVTILDVRSRLGGKVVPPGPDTRFVVIGLEKEMVGLFVDRVRRVVRFEPGDIEPPPRIASGEGSDSIAGVVERDGKIVILLDLARLLGGAVATGTEVQG